MAPALIIKQMRSVWQNLAPRFLVAEMKGDQIDVKGDQTDVKGERGKHMSKGNGD